MDAYKLSKHLADRTELVVGFLAQDIGDEAAALRVMERLQTVLQDAFEGGRPDDMALALRKNPPA